MLYTTLVNLVQADSAYQFWLGGRQQNMMFWPIRTPEYCVNLGGPPQCVGKRHFA